MNNLFSHDAYGQGCLPKPRNLVPHSFTKAMGRQSGVILAATFEMQRLDLLLLLTPATFAVLSDSCRTCVVASLLENMNGLICWNGLWVVGSAVTIIRVGGIFAHHNDDLKKPGC